MKIKDIASASIATLLMLSLTACSSGGGGGTSGPAAPGIAVSPATLSTSEDGTVASFSVALQTQPASDVDITFTSRDTSEGLIGSDNDTDWDWNYYDASVDLSFTPSDWNVPKTVKVKGQSDSILDGNQIFSVAVTWVWSMDLSYIGVAQPTVSVTNVDTSTASITVSTTTLSTTENNYSKGFNVGLSLPPEGTVDVPLTISDATEGSFSSSSIVTEKTLTFTSTSSQYVYVYPVDDIMADGNQTYTITVGPATSSAADYNGVSGASVSVTNGDDDTASFTLNKTALTTTEWGQTADFTVVLNTQPTADVVIPVTSPDPSEGLVSSFSAIPAASLDLTFTSANWNIPQTVTVNGQDDGELDGDTSYNITVGALTGAAEYALLSAQTVGVVNIDDDTARINIQGADLQTTEAGATDTFVVSLAKAPVGDVVINVTSNDTTEGRVQGGNSLTPVSTIALTFNATNWQTAQTVTVKGWDDIEVDGNQSFTVGVAIDTALTTDVDYAALAAQTVSVTNADNDVAGMTVSGSTQYITEGNTGTFTVNLNTKPAADVTIPVTARDSSEVLVENGATGQVATLDLTFTPVDWATPQTVTVHVVDDFLDESGEYHYIDVGSATSTDPNYDGLASKSKTVYVYDNDTAGFVVTPTTGLATSEDRTSYDFTVKLATEPFGTAFVNVSSGNTVEGLLSTAAAPTAASAVTLEFSAADWQTGQTVTVHGVDDSILDGPITYDVTVANITGYSAASSKTATVTNSDNDAGVSETKPLTIAELDYDGQVALAETSSYSMTLSAGWKYTVTAYNVTDDISLEVQDSAAATLCSSANTGTKIDESCTFTTPGDGSVAIIINGAGTENGAGFTLTLSEPMIATTFEAYGAASRDIFLYDNTILTNPSVWYLKTAYDGLSGDAFLTHDLIAGQTYYLKVDSYYSSGAYMVQVTAGAASLTGFGTATTDTAGEPGDDNATGAVALTLDTPLERYLTDPDIDWFKYTAPMPMP